MKIDWKRKLTSRKLWTSVASFVTLIMLAKGLSQNEAAQTAAIIMAGAQVVGYCLAEGLADSTSTTANKEVE
jgi:hypothetical protein